MRKRYTVLLLLLTTLLYACQPSGRETEIYIPPVTVEAETSDAGVYRWSQPSVFADMTPLVIESVSNERFGHDHSIFETSDPAAACFLRTTVMEDEQVTLGTFRVTEDGKLIKLCTSATCRDDIALPCTHLVKDSRTAIWCDGTLYLIGVTLSPETGNQERHFILCLRDGDTEFVKLFETTRVLNELQMCGGILYAVSLPEFEGDSHVYYAIDLDTQVYTEIITGDEEYHFGHNLILMTDDTGTYLTNSVLQRAGKCCDATRLDRGTLTGDGYWYLRDDTLWCAEAKVRGQVTRMLEDVWQFAVCGGTVYYLTPPTEPAEVLFYYQDDQFENGKVISSDTVPYVGYRNTIIRCADLTSDGRLMGDRAVFIPEGQEWFYLFDHFKQLGHVFSFTTIKPGNGTNIPSYKVEYIADGDRIQAVGSWIK